MQAKDVRHDQAPGGFTNLARDGPVALFWYTDALGPLGFHDIGYFHRVDRSKCTMVFDLQR
jgi:hypothetical protein